MSARTVAVVLNKGSGKQNGQDVVEDIRVACEHRGIAPEFVFTDDYDTVAKAAVAALAIEADAVIAAGGDGTISGVASVLVTSDCSMGIIPLGTFNYFARSLGIPQDIDGSIEVIAAGHVDPIRLGSINGEIFLNNASIGAYPAILQTREGIYERWGRSRIAAYWSVIKALTTRRTTLDLNIDVDGCEYAVKTPLVFAINNAFQLQEMGLAGQDCIAAGKMVLLIAPNASRWGLLKHAAALAMGKARRKTDYEMKCGTDIQINMRRKRRPVARDGEISRMTGPLHLSKTHTALQLIVPRDALRSVR